MQNDPHNQGAESEKKPPNLFHFEYTNIHNHRLALLKRLDTWHQICIPASFVVFGFFYQLGASRESAILLISAAILSSIIILMMILYARRIDRKIIESYPRILTIEILLGYHFYRDYLGNLGERESEFVRRCQEITYTCPDQLHEAVSSEFSHCYFPLTTRHTARLHFGAGVLIAAFIVMALIEVF